MLIQKLKNPKTPKYLEVKKLILSEKIFPWYWQEQSTDNDSINFQNIPFYSHVFLSKPEMITSKIPIIRCNKTEIVSEMLIELLHHNNVKINYFLRINANCVHPQQNIVNSVPHFDHEFNHKNIIVYLTDAGGKTFVGDDSHDPNEDDVIIFGSLKKQHYHQTPKNKRRIVIVATFV